MKRLVTLLLLAASTHAEPLSIFNDLIGDQWVSSAKLPNGEEVRSRTVWSWGAAKRLVRMRQFVLGKQGEVQRYETILAYDRHTKQIVYRVFSAAGLISRGTASASEVGVVLEQPQLESFPAMRTAYFVDKNEICVARISFKGKDGWKQRIESNLRRTKIENYKRLKLESGNNPLQPLAHFAATWEHRSTTESAVRAISVGKWSLHHRLLRFVDSWTSGKNDPEPFLERYVSFDPRTGKILLFAVHDESGILEGVISKEKNVVTWRLSGHATDGKPLEVRIRCKLLGKERHDWTNERRVEGKWERNFIDTWTSRPRK